MTPPRTEAGRALLEELSESPLDGARYAHHVVSLRLPAIEQQAATAALEARVEAVARGMYDEVIPRRNLDPAWDATAEWVREEWRRTARRLLGLEVGT